MGDISDKDELARVERYAQAHLDRANTIISGATKAALAWFVALAIIWSQPLERKLAQVRTAQRGQLVLNAASNLEAQRVGMAIANRLQRDENLVKQEELELPFSIKIKVPPQWVATLWLTLAFGLTWYLLDTRRRILRLIARGIGLLAAEVKAQPTYVRSLVGGAAWWLWPLPSRRGQIVTAQEFRRALGREGRSFYAGPLALLFCVIALIAAETRVVYVGFCITSYLTRLSSQPMSWWLLITAVNCFLFLASTLCLWRWFAPTPVPDSPANEHSLLVHRRELLNLIRTGAVVTIASSIWVSAATYAFASVTRRGTPRSRNLQRIRRRRKKKPHMLPLSHDAGLWENSRTKTVHVSSPQCKTCFIGTTSSHLTKIAATDVHWNGRGPTRSTLSSRRFESPASFLQQRDTLGLQPVQISNRAALLPAVDSHPHAIHRTFMIEQVALNLVHNKKEAEACRLLLDAIQAAPAFGLKTGMRLYDLLAGLTVRFNRPVERSMLLRVMQQEMARTSQTPALRQSGRAKQEGLENKAAQPVAGRMFTFLFRLAGNELPDDTSGSQDHRPSRKHEHHIRAKNPLSNKAQTPPRRKHDEYLKEEVRKRIKKWNDPSHGWHNRWADRGKPVKWGCERINTDGSCVPHLIL